MKKLISIFCVLLCLVGCDESLETKDHLPGIPLSFTLELEKEVIPFAISRSAATNQEEETSPENSSYKTINYLVFGETGDAVLKSKKSLAGEEDFGIIHDTLTVGKYRVAFIAHSSPEMGIISTKGSVTFKEPSDTFYTLYNLTVSGVQESQHDITLNRVVSRIEFVATDAITSSLKQFDIEITNHPNGFSALTGQGNMTATTKTTHTFQPEEVGTKNFMHSVYSFSPVQSKNTEIILTAIKKDNRVSRTQSITVIPEVNKIIRYTGKLYTFTEANDTFLVTVNNEWGGVQENVLPE